MSVFTRRREHRESLAVAKDEIRRRLDARIRDLRQRRTEVLRAGCAIDESIIELNRQKEEL